MGTKPSIIAIMTQKGGVGKSCLSNILANEIIYWYKKQDKDYSIPVLLLDIDLQHTNADKRAEDLDKLKCDINSQHYASMSIEEKTAVRALKFRYILLEQQYNFTSYTLLNVNTRSNTSIDFAINQINNGGYKYVIIDFPGTMEQEGTGEFFSMINHLFIPLTSNVSDVHGVKRFMEELSHITSSSNLHTQHFIINKYDSLKKRKVDILQNKLEQEYNIQFLHTRIKNTSLIDNNTLIPQSIKINLSKQEVAEPASYLQDFAEEVISIINPYKSE